MAQHVIPTQEELDALRGLVRSGAPLSDRQRDRLATLLDALGAAAQVAADVDVAYTRLLRSLA